MTAKPIYTTTVTANGGREGRARSEEGALDVALVVPTEFGGPGGAGTNPEQLFAAGYAACFLSALKHAARLEKVKLPQEPSVKACVGILALDDGYGLTVALTISLPGIDKPRATQLVDQAHQGCPYSRATRGNIDVTLTLA